MTIYPTHFYTASAEEYAAALAQNFQDEGTAGYVYGPPVSGPAPLYRARHTSSTSSHSYTSHFYTMTMAERDYATNNLGYVGEGIACYLFGYQQAGTIPLYRAYASTIDDHFYTTDLTEFNQALGNGYSDEGIAGYVFAAPGEGLALFYRMLHSDTPNLHFYTTNPEEVSAAKQQGYVLESRNAGYVYGAPNPGPIPLFRAYNSTTGGHLYTASISEYDTANSQDGYTGEGIACYVLAQAGPTAIPLYRAYQQATGDFLYTTALDEYTTVQGLGPGPAPSPDYVGQGIAGYVMPSASSEVVQFHRLYGNNFSGTADGPGKGVSYYMYVNGPGLGIEAQACDAVASSPAANLTFSSEPAFQTGNVQIGVGGIGIGLLGFGSFSWNTTTSPTQVTGSVEISPYTGNTGDGNLVNMMNTPSVVTANYVVSYGFYDAGPGLGGLTNQDQAYVYLTPSMNNWMGQLAAQYPQVNDAPFSSFVLPGAHDAGTFDVATANALLQATGGVASAFLRWIGYGLLGAAVELTTAAQGETAVVNLAVTQKDNIATMLALGCRYFDFRPGQLPPPYSTVAGDIYHIHTLVPGYPFGNFVSDVLEWLSLYTSEIVVMNFNTQGFLSETPLSIEIPSADLLNDILTKVQQKTAPNVVIGTKDDLATSYANLVAANKRLILLNQFGDWQPATKYDSYEDSAYATTDPMSIINVLAAMNAASQNDYDYTILQLQGTTTNLGAGVVVPAVLSQSDASSPLMSTKAYFDSVTYPWVSTQVPNNLTADKLVVLLNDFVDNALAQVAQQLTKVRCGIT